MFVPSALAIAAALWIAYLVALAVEKRIFDQPIRRWKSLSKLGKCAVALVLVGFVAFAGTKPSPGDGGGTDGGDDPAITNVVEGVEGDATNTNGVQSGEAESFPLQGDNGSVDFLGSGARSSFSRSGKDSASPLSEDEPTNPPISHLSRITHSMCAAGFVLQSVGTNETFDFSAPEGAFVATNWVLHGTANARIHTDLKEWTFPFGNDFVTNLAAFASGKVMTDTANPDQFFAPFAASLGIPPEANWGELDETNRPSIYWQTMTEQNAMICTWQNVLLDRMPTNPVSFQVEFRPGGSFIYRYDLSRLASDELLTNVTVGVKNGDGEWFSPAVGRSLTSLQFARVTLGDLINPDRDGDGVPTEVELFDFGTDPDLADSDFDGKSDGEEIATGTNPNSRDTDNDGLVDGIDPDPQEPSTFVDEDEDGIDDNLERHYFGGTDVIDDPTEVKEDGFTLETEILAGINPTNAAPTAVTYITNSLVSWKLFDGFAAQLPNAGGVLWSRSFRINKTSPWQQYFVSAAPDAAAGWMLEGMRLEWEDSNGNSGSVVRSPSGDSWRIPLSTNATENLTLRLRATGAFARTATPLYLIAYVPEVRFVGGCEVRDGDGAVYSVFTNGSLSAIGLTVDRSRRPCRASLSAEESDPSVLFAMESAGDLVYSGDASGGEVRVLRPGFHPLPQTPAALSRPAVRRLLRNGNGNGGGLLVLSPSVWYGKDPCRMGLDLDYDWKKDSYTYVDRYPLNGSCLWRNWRKDVTGQYVCDCEPGVSAGVGDVPVGVTTSLDIDGGRCVGTVSVCGVPVWSGEALHNAGNEDLCWTRLLDSELLTHLDECQSCEDTCTGGVCKYGDEGTSLSSLAFKVCVGAPRKGQVSGFAWFKTDGPITVAPSTFLYTFRSDADVSVTTNGNSRHVVCGDFRGRDILIERVSDVTRLTVRDAVSQTLDHTWEFSNENDSPSRIRIRKISKLNNPLEDWTYVYDEGTWTRFDNLKQISEELYKDDGLNEPGDGAKRETRIVRDAEGNTLSYVYTVSRRIGECENAVLRETYRSEWTGLNDRVREADYWCDPEHRARHGQLRLLTGNDRPWEYHDFDEFGREVLRVEQRNGAECNVGIWEYEIGRLVEWGNGGMEGACPSVTGLADAFVTVYGYEPMDGDDANADDGSRVRRETKYVVTAGTATVIGRTWWRYTHGFCGYETVKAEKWRAASSAGLASPTAPGNAYSYEETFTDTATGIPLVLRNQVAESLDENGILTRNSYDIAQNVVTCTARKYFVSSATNNQQPTTSNPLPTYTQTDFDSVYGLVLRTATYLTDGGTLLAEERSTYDEKNRLRSTTYSDGTSLTNAYSCCRLLWRCDREGRKTLRSAVTGYDQIYNADEEVWLADISTNGGYRVTQHFFDGLGRETNTVTCIGHEPGSFTVPQPPFVATVPSPSWVSSRATTAYPYGGSDYTVHTDARGVETVTRTDFFENGAERCEEVLTNGVRVTLTKTRSVFGGGTSTRREWARVTTAPSPSAPLWTEESRFSDYTTDGRRIDYTVTVSSDCGTVTNSVTAYDFLGRIVSSETPIGVTTYAYDGFSSRTLTTHYEAGSVSRSATYLYNEQGEQNGVVQDDVTRRSDVSYAVASGIVWRVTCEATVGPSTNALTVTRERMTGLGDGLLSHVETTELGGPSTVIERTLDAETGVVTETTTSSVSSPVVTESFCGLETKRTADGESVTSSYDALGRCVGRARCPHRAATQITQAPVESYIHNPYGDLVERHTFTNETETVIERYAYDMFGRRVSTVNALGDETLTVYDANGNVIAESGATYPVRYAYDSQNRRMAMWTNRSGDEWDMTRWSYDPATGLCTSKTYEDGSVVTYEYTPDGLLETTRTADGHWTRNIYDAKRQLVGVQYDHASNVTYVRDVYGRETSAANGNAAYAYTLAPCGIATSESVTVGDINYTLLRSLDDQGRIASFEIHNSGQTSIMNFAYRPDGRLGSVTTGEVAVSYAYSSDGYDTGYTLAVEGGATFVRTLVRDPYRRDLVTAVNNSFGSSFAYSYDALSRPVTRNADIFAYNFRSEVIGANVAGQSESYDYDNIGNSTFAAFDSITNRYVSNGLNQYTTINRTIEQSEQSNNPIYDADGNLVSFGDWSYAYDSVGRLTTVSSNGLVVATNYYDHQGRRVRLVTQTAAHTFIYDGWNVVLELVEHEGVTDRIEYYWGKDISGSLQEAGGVGGLLYLKRNGSIFVPIYDAYGNVMEYRAADGSLAASYVYDTFGLILAKSGPLADSFRFRHATKCFDAATGIYYYIKRFYSPIIRRWLNRDPIEERGGLNLYSFCRNNPLSFVDKDGQAYFAVRKLSAFNKIHKWSDITGLSKGIDDFANQRNNELLHEQLFYEDNPNNPVNSVGWSSGSHFNPLFGPGTFIQEPFSGEYMITSSGYNDCVMRKAQDKVGPPPYYLLVGPIFGIQQNNCQDWGQRMRDMYWRLLEDPKIVCECKVGLQIVR